jgi:hypothetical protein
MYKRGPGRPRKLRIRQFDEDGVRRPRRGKKHCTRCGKPGHTVISCKSKTQDPDSLKRKVRKIVFLFGSNNIMNCCMYIAKYQYCDAEKTTKG